MIPVIKETKNVRLLKKGKDVVVPAEIPPVTVQPPVAPPTPAKIDTSLLPAVITEYKKQLAFYFRVPLFSYFDKMSNESPDFRARLTALKSVDRKELQAQVTNTISPSIPLYEMVKMLIVSTSMLMGSVRSIEEPEKIDVKVPSLEDFIMTLVLYLAQYIYPVPSILTILKTDSEEQIWKKSKIYRKYISYSVDAAVRHYIPVSDILKKYSRHFEPQVPKEEPVAKIAVDVEDE